MQGQMRLQKYLSRAGVASRRAAEELISAGRVSVNGKVVTKLGTKVTLEDSVMVDGEPAVVNTEAHTFVLHKPAGYVTTMSDPQGRPCVASLLPVTEFPNIFPVGRLDRDTSGLLLASTDGQLGNALLHPSAEVSKVYYALLNGKLQSREVGYLREGVMLSDGMTAPADIEVLEGELRAQALAAIGYGEGASGYAQGHDGKNSRAALEDKGDVVRVGIHEGRNRQVRRMFEALGLHVIALHRQQFGPLDVTDVPRGEVHEVTGEVLATLYACAGVCMAADD